MNQIILHPYEQQTDQSFSLQAGLRLSHLHTVLKAQVGDTINFGVLNGKRGQAHIKSLDQHSCELQVISQEESLKPWCHLIVGLSRPPTVRKILEHGSCAGVASFTFVQAQLSEKSYAESKVLKEFQKYLHLGLAQSRAYTTEPTVQVCSLKDLDRLQLSATRFLATTQGHKLESLRASEEVTLAIGPERGWTTAEQEFFLAANFKPIRLSESILRVEIAAFYALSQLEFLRI